MDQKRGAGQTSFGYDALGRVISVTFPSTFTESYNYDGVGNLTSKTDRKGQRIGYAYDALDRLVTKTYPDTTTVAYTYDADSRLTQVVDATGTYGFSYDDVGRLTGATTRYSFLTRTLTTGYTYDAASNRLTFTDPEGGVTNYSYDTLNRLTNLTDWGSNSFGFSYDALGRRTLLTQPTSITNTHSYDNLSRLLSVVHQAGSKYLEGVAYTYDAAGGKHAPRRKPKALRGTPRLPTRWNHVQAYFRPADSGPGDCRVAGGGFLCRSCVPLQRQYPV